MSKPYLPEVLAKQVETWESEGYAVFHNRFRGLENGDSALTLVVFDLIENYPEYVMLEYNTEKENGDMYIIVKCQKKEEYEKSKD